MNSVFVDVDSQLDFLYPAGALYVPQAERILPALARLNRFAAAHGIPVISTTDAHAENDPEFAHWPPHCVVGTWGQRKPEATLLDRRTVLVNREGPLEIEGAQQIVMEKQTLDAFQSPHMARVLAALGAGRAVLYGVVTEVCVLYAARGLRRLGLPVVLVTDAVAGLSEAGAHQALEEMRALGVSLETVGQVANLPGNRPQAP